MKNKFSFRPLSRWVIAPLLVGSLFAWSVSPAYSGNDSAGDASHPAPKQAAIAVPAKDASADNADIQEIKERIKELEAKERQNYAMELEGQRKKIDWWFSFLAILAAIVAISGGFIPYLMGRKDKEIIEQDKAQIRKLLEEVKGMKADAEGTVEKIHQKEVEAEKILEGFQSGKPSDASDSKISEAVATIEQDKSADTPLRLRAEAIAASQAQDATKAYALWNALIALVPNDASTHFNAGYWAAQLSDTKVGEEKLYWIRLVSQYNEQALRLKPDFHEAANNWGSALANEASAASVQDLSSAHMLWKQAGEKYLQALTLKPDMYEAANNWGTALSDEARALSAQDLPSARALWKQAGEKFLQALSLKPDDYEAANSWGAVLAAEARAISAQDLPSACALWKQAGKKYQQALSLKPEMSEAANNWGTALADEARALSAQDLPSARALWKEAGEKYLQAITLKPDMYEAANNWGIALDAEASAMSAQDLAIARILWKQAGEKFQQALNIKPDKHDAANNWGATLLFEVNVLTDSGGDESKRQLAKAEQLLLDHADAAPGLVAYNLACVYGRLGDVHQCLYWLKVGHTHKTLPECAHLREDKDLNAVRESPEFVAWLVTVCDDQDAQNLTQDKPA
ncbi:MAG: hypothetical protein PHQ60_02450 [Sideroxydans sp.]|nr:hypothetical protein [Sideroxydans sp.]